MPIYEFHCADCGASFEVMRLSASGFHDVECPKCQGKKVSREMSTFAVSALSSASPVPMCEQSGSPCANPNIPGCASGACGF